MEKSTKKHFSRKKKHHCEKKAQKTLLVLKTLTMRTENKEGHNQRGGHNLRQYAIYYLL